MNSDSKLESSKNLIPTVRAVLLPGCMLKIVQDKGFGNEQVLTRYSLGPPRSSSGEEKVYCCWGKEFGTESSIVVYKTIKMVFGGIETEVFGFLPGLARRLSEARSMLVEEFPPIEEE